MINANPVVHASFYDESGINISDSGIGHKMSVTLDKDLIFDDVYSYYTPDPENPLGGYISYPLSGISSGEHTLKLTVYDNANNASSKTVSFSVGAVRDPAIRDLSTDVNPGVDKCCLLCFGRSSQHPHEMPSGSFRIVRQKSLAGRQLRHQRHAGRHADTMGSQG